MNHEHTAKVLAAVYRLISTRLDGKSPLTMAAAHIDTSFSTLKRRLYRGSLSMNDFESLMDLMDLDPGEVYSHPEKVLQENDKTEGRP